MGGKDHCCVVNCSNRRCNLPKGFSFHRIPSRPIARRNAWIRATGRKLGHKKGELTVTENTKVCGAHFVSGRKSDDPTSVDYIPTINIPYITKTPKRLTNNSSRAKLYSEAVDSATSAKRKVLSKKGKVLFPCDINDVAAEVDVYPESANISCETMDTSETVSCATPDHNYHKHWIFPDTQSIQKATQTHNQVNDICVQTSDHASAKVNSGVQVKTSAVELGVQVDTFGLKMSNMTQQRVGKQEATIKELNEIINLLKSENETLKQQMFSADNYLTSDASVLFYTGLPNIATFNALYAYLERKAKKLSYWQGGDSTSEKLNFVKGPARKLSLKNEFFAVLVRLRLGLFVDDISNRLNISPSLFSQIFTTWIRFLSLELQELFPYPTQQQVKENMPESFAKFPGTRMILDCTEIFIQKPSALRAQRETWSSYKHRNTFKALVGITPDGTISYISDLYGGAASDKFIVKDSGVLDLIEPGDNIMADRGFEIADELRKRGAGLNIPPFRNGKFQLSSEDVETTRRIAEVRIHVERAIQRMKCFHILDGTMPLSLQVVADDIFKTCSYLTNFQTPIIK